MLVELAAKDVRRLGLAPTHKQSYPSAEARRDARAKLFKAMDADGSGKIGFDEWLEYSVTHISEKVKSAPLSDVTGAYTGKDAFLRFVTSLSQSKASAEYKEFYNLLLTFFTEADQDHDGKVNLQEFDQMVEKAGAIPRMYGLAPTSAELYPTSQARLASRKQHFDAMDKDASGYISFDEWLDFTYDHVRQKVSVMTETAQPPVEETLQAMSRAEFITFCTQATSNQGSDEFRMLYNFLLNCFTTADSDYDGKVDAEEFDMMIDLAATPVRRLGLAPTHKQTYPTAEQRRVARAALFKTIDTDSSGTIGFEEWVSYCVKHISEKVVGTQPGNIPGMRGSKQDFLLFIRNLTTSRKSAEYKEFYSFLLECFTEADTDRDGRVGLQEFDLMVEKAGAIPRAHGLAPSTDVMYKTREDRLESRKRHFLKMDSDRSGYISFDEWLEFTYTHVHEKAFELV
jgi:Ca2+-binding EF-hand superfamily protein